MFCVKCNNSEHTKCIDDMLQIGYVAELYKCYLCEGNIFVQYSGLSVDRNDIKEYSYNAG